MKLLFLPLLLISLAGAGQRDTSGYTINFDSLQNKADTIKPFDWYPVSTSTFRFILTVDTIKVVMFCADTILLPGNTTFSVAVYNDGKTENVFEARNRVPYIFWRFGYFVSRWNAKSYYLDENKKPMAKSVIVFMSIKAL